MMMMIADYVKKKFVQHCLKMKRKELYSLFMILNTVTNVIR